MYECKTDLEDIGLERFYYLWTHNGYIVYHWNRVTKTLDKLSSKFFINLEDARACARDFINITDPKKQLMMKIHALQEELKTFT